MRALRNVGFFYILNAEDVVWLLDELAPKRDRKVERLSRDQDDV